MNDTADPDEWIAGDSPIERRELYIEVAGAMRRAARKGLRRMIGRLPDEHDVEDVLMQAFNELCTKDLGSVRSSAAMGCQISYRRGQDRGRRVLREQKRLATANPDGAVSQPSLDVVNETAFATLTAALARCMERLTVDQRAVVSATVAGRMGEEPMKLSEWVELPAQRAAKTYEAWRRQRGRGVQSLRRCVEKEREEGNVLDG